MPLRARIDGTDYLAPGMSPAMWTHFREEIRAGRAQLVLPCCSHRGFLRTSRRGLQHFVHARGASCASAKRESPRTLAISTAILQVALSMGLSATADVEISGHPCPVLITVPEMVGRIAFLGYEREYPPRKMKEIQHHLSEAYVRGCWLVFNDQQIIMPPSVETPVFLLAKTGQKVTVPDREPAPLSKVVGGLLQGYYQFRDKLLARRKETVKALIYSIPCPSCKKAIFAYTLSGSHESVCGVRMGLMDQDRYRPEVLAALRRVLHPETMQLGHVEWGPGEEKDPISSVLKCPHCHEPVYETRIRGFIRRTGDPLSTHEVEINWKEPNAESRPHWCLSEKMLFC